MDVSAILSSLITRLPLLVVCATAFVIAAGNRARYPRAANLTLLASLGMLVQALMASVVFLYLPRSLHRSNSAEDVGLIMAGVSCTFNVLSAVFLGLLVAAVFVDRDRPHTQPYRASYPPLDEPTVVDELRRPKPPDSHAFRDRPER